MPLIRTTFANHCYTSFFHFPDQREERPREEMLIEILNLGEGGPLCTEQAASTVYSVLRSDRYRIYCVGWPALYIADHLT
jgi:hypothetical protein